MEQILINLIAGALGGVGAGKSSPTFDLGMVGNIISGLVGGGVLGQIVTLLLPSVVAAASNAARMVREGGGFHAETDDPIMIAQVQLIAVPDCEHAKRRIEAHAEEIIQPKIAQQRFMWSIQPHAECSAAGAPRSAHLEYVGKVGGEGD